MTLTPITLTDGPGVMVLAHVASLYSAEGTAEVIMDSHNLLIEDFVSFAVADGYTKSLAGIYVSGVSGLIVQPTMVPTTAPTPIPSMQPSALPTFQPSPFPTTGTPTAKPSPFPTISPTPIPSTNPTPQPTSQAMGVVKDFTAAGLVSFTMIMFAYLFYSYFSRRKNRGGSPDSVGYTSIAEIELGKGNEHQLPISIHNATSPNGALRSTPGVKERVKKKVAEYIKVSPAKRSNAPTG